MNELALAEYPHRYVLTVDQVGQAVELILWCVNQYGYADYSMQYDYRKHELFMHATGHSNGWYPQGYSSINFQKASDLMLFKLTFGNG